MTRTGAQQVQLCKCVIKAGFVYTEEHNRHRHQNGFEFFVAYACHVSWKSRRYVWISEENKRVVLRWQIGREEKFTASW